MKRLHGYRDEDAIRTGSGGSTGMANVAETCGTDQIATVGLGRIKESKAHCANERAAERREGAGAGVAVPVLRVEDRAGVAVVRGEYRPPHRAVVKGRGL